MQTLLDTIRYAAQTRLGRQTWPIFALALLLPVVGYTLAHPETGLEANLYIPFLLTGSTSIALICWFFLIELVRQGELEQVAWHAGNDGALLRDSKGEFRRSNRVLEDWLGFQPTGKRLKQNDWDDLLKTADAQNGPAEGWVQGRSCRHFIHIRVYDLKSYRRDWTLVVFHDKTDEYLRTQQLMYARQQAERASKAKDKFISVLDREIRNPIGGITGWTELARLELKENNWMNQPLGECMEGIDQCASDLQTLVIEALEYESLDDAASRDHMERVFMQDFLDYWMENYQRYFPKRGNVLRIIADDGVQAEVLELQLRYFRKVLVCLLGSAWKHADNGTVELELKLLNSSADQLCRLGIYIRDNGRGRHASDCQDLLRGCQLEGSPENMDQELGLLQAARLLKAIRASSIACADLANGGLEIAFELLAARVNVANLAPMAEPRSLCYISLDPTDMDPLGMFDDVHWEPSITLTLEREEQADVYLVGTDVPDLTDANLAKLKKLGLVIIVGEQYEDDHAGYQTLKKPLSTRDVLRVRGGSTNRQIA